MGLSAALGFILLESGLLFGDLLEDVSATVDDSLEYFLDTALMSATDSSVAPLSVLNSEIFVCSAEPLYFLLSFFMSDYVVRLLGR